MSKHTPEPRYYVSGESIWKNPIETENDDGSKNITLGFKVCTVSECVSATKLVAFFNRAEACKDACTGIPDSALKDGAVKELVEIADDLLFAFCHASMTNPEDTDRGRTAQSVIAQFKEEG